MAGGRRVSGGRFRWWLLRAALLPLGLLLGLLLAEGVLRVSGLDWRVVRRGLSLAYSEEVAFTELVDDPILVHLPAAGSAGSMEGQYGRYSFQVNSLGFRSPERAASKPEGVFRVMVFGGSNVFGDDVGDEDTWPAQLEAALQSSSSVPVEVWNGGVSAYNPWQSCHRARLSLEPFQPDLVILAPSNFNLSRHFPQQVQDLAPYFLGDRRLWLDLYPLAALDGPLELEALLYWLDRSALLRLAVAVRYLDRRRRGAVQVPNPVDANLESARACFSALAQETPLLIFGCPTHEPQDYFNYFPDRDIPFYLLRADGRPEEYRHIHPPPEVHRWYGEKLAVQLRARRLVPPRAPESTP